VEGNVIGTIAANPSLGNDKGVVIDGGAAFNSVGDLAVTKLPYSNLIAGNRDAGVEITGEGTSYNYVQRNSIGTSPSEGGALLGNFEGVLLDDGASHNSIGGPVPLGAFVTGNVIWGNDLLGLEISRGAHDNLVGGLDLGSSNLISANGYAGVEISGSGTMNNTVQGNVIGAADEFALAPAPNSIGVSIDAGANNNTIGGALAGAGNIISGNQNYGLAIEGTGTANNVIEGNEIGVGPNSFHSNFNLVPNGTGVLIGFGASYNIIGGPLAADGNVISDNLHDGIDIQGSGTTANLVQGNFIGTDPSGQNALPNLGDGVRIDSGASNNSIDGTPEGGSNTIAFNQGAGVDVRDSSSVGNSIRLNAIFGNAGLGIDLGGDGVTHNTPGGPHTGPNDLQNYPDILDATPGTVRFSLDSAPDTSYIVDFYANVAPDPSENGQGRTFLGSQVVSQVKVNQTFPYNPVPGEAFITATATALGRDDTSEFSGAVGPPQTHVSNGNLLIRLDNSQSFRLGRDPLFPQLLDLAFGRNGASTFSIDPSAFAQVVINGAANDVIDLESVPAGVTISVNAGTGSAVNVSPSARDLGTIQGNLDITGEEGTALNLHDEAARAGRSYALSSKSFTWGSSGAISFDLPGSMTLNGTAFNDTVIVQSLPGNSVALHGGGGANNTLIGPDTANTWMLAQPSGEEGTLNDSLVFDSFGSLIGGQSLDRFVVPDGAYIPEFLSGGDGLHGGSNNTLDLSGFTGPLTEQIRTSVYGGNVTTISGGSVTSVVRAFALCQNVIGGQSDDHFIFDQGFGLTTVDGGPGNNTLDFSPYFLSPSFLTPPAWVFEILGHNSGLVPGVIAAYSNIQNLIGTKVDDRYGFRGNAYLDGTIDGQGGMNSLEYTQSAASVTVNLQTGLASYVNFQGGSAPQPGGITGFQKFVGSPGPANTLIGPDTSNTWTITGLNNGSVNAVSFTGFQDLTGGAAADTFVFQPGGSIAGNVDGGGGGNALDYSHYTGSVTVDLALNLASLVKQGASGGVFHIANVTGSVGNNFLVGDANANVLIGGTGRSVLIGGPGGDTLDASRSMDDNLLIGGRTDWDMNIAALNAIFAEWARTDLGFSDRRSELLNGSNGQGQTPLNQVSGQLILLTLATNPQSNNGTVHADGTNDVLIGTNLTNPLTTRRAHDWFVFDALDILMNFDPANDRKNKVE
jgi:hypothetical protein